MSKNQTEKDLLKEAWQALLKGDIKKRDDLVARIKRKFEYKQPTKEKG